MLPTASSVLSASSANVITGNLIGVGSDSVTLLGNRGRGILLGTNAANFQIGGTAAGEANVIAHNFREGVYIAGDAAAGNEVRGNSIFFNTELGIDLAVNDTVSAGVTPNDPADADAGANHLQNKPILNSAASDGLNLTVSGSFNSYANETFAIDFYSNTGLLGVNEGETWIGEINVSTDFNGDATFTFPVAASIPAGSVVTATATRSDGSTSEFSAGAVVSNADGTPLISIRDGGVIEGDTGTRNAVFSVELSNTYPSEVTVDYVTVGDSATTGVDFVDSAGQVRFPANSTTQTILVPVSGDTLDESRERFFVQLSAASNATILDDEAIGWISDNDNSSDAVPYGASTRDTSEFMMGTVHVTVVALESDGTVDPNLERFTPTQIEEVHRKVSEGLQWWEDLLSLQGAVHSVDYSIDFTYVDDPIKTPYEPLTRDGITSSAAQEPWINSFLDTVGANTAASQFSDLDAFNHLQRLEHGTNWAFTIFITNGSMDGDGRYSDNSNAWAYAGGPYSVIQQHRSQVTVAHEVGHIFYNLDEYPGGRSYFDRRGYYNTQNLNAYENHPDLSQRVISLMAETAGDAFAAYTSSPTSLEMIGWRDSDANGVYDVLDVPMTLSGSGLYDPALQQYRFQGSSQVATLPNQNPSGSGNSITLNRVSRLQHRINGGDWTDVALYDVYATSIDVTVPVPPGSDIELRTIDDSTAVTSNAFVDATTPIDFGDAPSSYGTLFADNGARHLASGPRLGDLRDAETEGLPSSTAVGDDQDGFADEDGVMFGAVAIGALAGLNIDLQNAAQGRIDAWLDFGGDGVWDASDKILDNALVMPGLQTLNFSVPIAAVAGDTFARVRVSTNGGLAADGLAADGEVEDYLVTIVDPPRVSSTAINGGDDQRSNLTEVVVTFDSEVTAPASAFQIKQRVTNTVLDTLLVSSAVIGGKTVSTLTFGGGGNLVIDRANGGNSLVDGNYELMIDAAQIIKVGVGSSMTTDYRLGDDAADNFFRFFADHDGDRDTDTSDLPAFGATFRKNSGDAGFDPLFDFEGDNDVDTGDLIQFGQRFRQSLPFA